MKPTNWHHNADRSSPLGGGTMCTVCRLRASSTRPPEHESGPAASERVGELDEALRGDIRSSEPQTCILSALLVGAKE